MWKTGRTTSLLAFGLLVGLVALSGCSQDQAVPTANNGASDQTYDLNDPYGGLTTTDESAAFGDAELMASVSEESEVDDPMADDPDVRAAADNPATKVYAVSILWGTLAAQSVDVSSETRDGDTYDWSGSVALGDGGSIVLRSVVSFERGDYLVLPRVDRRTLSWISHTGVGYDGIRFFVYQPPITANVAPDTLTFSTPLYTRSIPVAELDGMDEVVKVDDNGNEVRIQAFETTPAADVRGFIHGQWDAVPAGEKVGHFRGLWVSEFGGVYGFVRGAYGVNDVGEQVFFGKYIDRSGRFRGIIRGTWDRTEEATSDGREAGWFRGAWLGGTRDEVGRVRGRWVALPNRPGFFSGNWCLGCPSEQFVQQ